jgi:hypothetical protein
LGVLFRALGRQAAYTHVAAAAKDYTVATGNYAFDVPDDGDCLFHAVRAAMGLSFDVRYLRYLAVQCVAAKGRRDPDFCLGVLLAVQAPNGPSMYSMEDYERCMSRSKVFAAESEAAALGKLFNVDVRILQLQGDRFVARAAPATGRPVVDILHTGMHFMAVLRRGTNGELESQLRREPPQKPVGAAPRLAAPAASAARRGACTALEVVLEVARPPPAPAAPPGKALGAAAAARAAVSGAALYGVLPRGWRQRCSFPYCFVLPLIPARCAACEVAFGCSAACYQCRAPALASPLPAACAALTAVF